MSLKLAILHSNNKDYAVKITFLHEEVTVLAQMTKIYSNMLDVQF